MPRSDTRSTKASELSRRFSTSMGVCSRAASVECHLTAKEVGKCRRRSLDNLVKSRPSIPHRVSDEVCHDGPRRYKKRQAGTPRVYKGAFGTARRSKTHGSPLDALNVNYQMQSTRSIILRMWRFWLDPETGQPHIWEHGVSEDEVRQVLSNPVEETPGR